MTKISEYKKIINDFNGNKHKFISEACNFLESVRNEIAASGRGLSHFYIATNHGMRMEAGTYTLFFRLGKKNLFRLIIGCSVLDTMTSALRADGVTFKFMIDDNPPIYFNSLYDSRHIADNILKIIDGIKM